MLHNSSEVAFLLLPLHLLIVSSSLRLLAAKSGISVFSKDNVGKGRGDDPRSIGVDRGTEADNPGIETDAIAGADDPGIVANNSNIATDDPSTAADDSSIAADNLGTGTDIDMGVDNPGIAADDPGTGTDTDVGADNPGKVASNKIYVRTASLFALRRALFLLAFSFESVTASLPSSLPFSSLTTLRSKPVLSY